MAKKLEQKFLTELKKSFLEHCDKVGEPTFWYKIPDQPHIGPMRFDSPKPFDVIVINSKGAIAIEAKAFDKWKSLSLRDIRDSQVEGLTRFSECGGGSMVALNVRIAADKAKNVKHTNRLYIFPWDVLHNRLKVSSIKAKELKDNLPFIEGSGGRFDVSLMGDRICFDAQCD